MPLGLDQDPGTYRKTRVSATGQPGVSLGLPSPADPPARITDPSCRRTADAPARRSGIGAEAVHSPDFASNRTASAVRPETYVPAASSIGSGSTCDPPASSTRPSASRIPAAPATGVGRSAA